MHSNRTEKMLNVQVEIFQFNLKFLTGWFDLISCMHAFLSFYRFYRDKGIPAFPNENAVLKFRQPHFIGPKPCANIIPVNQ